MNCKAEFLEEILGKEVLCAIIEDIFVYDKTKYFFLKLNYTIEDFNIFLASIDFEYDEGYGSQHIEGTIFYKDNTWSERLEYDGSEWWSYKKFPEIPKELL